MSKKIDMKKLAQMAKRRVEPKGTTSTGAKGIVIGEKRPQDEMPDISPSKNGKQVADTKKKWSMLPPNDKKKRAYCKGPNQV